MKVWACICSYPSCFAFSLDDVKGYKGRPIHILFEDDHLIFRCLYKLNMFEKISVQRQYQELSAIDLIELFNGEYTSDMIMSLKKIFLIIEWKRQCVETTA